MLGLPEYHSCLVCCCTASIMCRQQQLGTPSIGNTNVTHEPDIVARISCLYSRLRDAEQKIARLILDDINFAAQASISELAQKAGVSEATVTRFAKAVDCKTCAT